MAKRNPRQLTKKRKVNQLYGGSRTLDTAMTEAEWLQANGFDEEYEQKYGKEAKEKKDEQSNQS